MHTSGESGRRCRKKAPEFRRTLVEHVRAMEKAGTSLVFMQELHPDIPVDIPRGLVQAHATNDSSCNLRVWLKESTLEFLATTQEQVLDRNDSDGAHQWRKWQKVWVESQRVILCANAHSHNQGRRGEASELQGKGFAVHS